MSMIHQKSGCKVGWETYDVEEEANEAALRETKARELMFADGYDFGYQWPGSIQHVKNHPDFGEVWIVTTV